MIIAKVSWHNPGFHTPRMDELSREVKLVPMLLLLMLKLMLTLIVVLVLMLWL